MSTSDIQAPPRAQTLPAELHIYLESAADIVQQRQPKYRFEIWQVFLGQRRKLREFPVAGNQLGRLKMRWAAKFRVPKEHIFDHTVPQEEVDDAKED